MKQIKEIQMDSKNINFMRKLIFIALYLLFMSSIQGQIALSATIHNESNDSIVKVYASITNFSQDSLFILDLGWHTNQGLILKNGVSFSTFYAYSSSQSLISTSDPYPLSFVDRTNTLIKLGKGGTHVVSLYLFDINGCKGVFKESIRHNMKYLDAKIHVKYFRKGSSTQFETDIFTNRISF